MNDHEPWSSRNGLWGWLWKGKFYDVHHHSAHYLWLKENWKLYDMPEPGSERNGRDVYEFGLIRVGSNRISNTLHFEGRGDILADNFQIMKDLAENHGFDREVLEPKNW